MLSANRRFFVQQRLLSRSQASRVRDVLAGALPWSDLDAMERAAYENAQREASCAVERQSVARRTEDFMLLYHARYSRVVECLLACRVPLAATRLLALCFELMREEDGEVIAQRSHLLHRLDVSPSNLSLALKALVDAGALIRVRRPDPGKQGRGHTRYFVNPRLATYLDRDSRAAAQAVAPEIGNVVSLPSERRSRAPVFPSLVS